MVAVPIGNPQDISLRALETLKAADLIIGEERKETARLLRSLKIDNKPIELLNEHSDSRDIETLIELCRSQNVALVSDAGTPGFCDPGANLVQRCRSQGIAVTSNPGASSLMTLLSLSGHRLDRFVFEGFLPAERESRESRLTQLIGEKRALILMDTPYRLGRLLSDLSRHMADRRILIGLNLTSSEEKIREGFPTQLEKEFQGQKAEFILIVLPKN